MCALDAAPTTFKVAGLRVALNALLAILLMLVLLVTLLCLFSLLLDRRRDRAAAFSVVLLFAATSSSQYTCTSVRGAAFPLTTAGVPLRLVSKSQRRATFSCDFTAPNKPQAELALPKGTSSHTIPRVTHTSFSCVFSCFNCST